MQLALPYVAKNSSGKIGRNRGRRTKVSSTWPKIRTCGSDMGLLKRFLAWLTTSGSNRPKKGHPDLYPIDVDKLARELNLVEDAKRFGAAGIPAADAKALSGPEAAIVQRVEKARQDYVDWAVLRLSVLSQDLGRRNVTQVVNRARQADKEFERKASALLTENDAVLRKLSESARKQKLELDDFQAANGLSRDAHYPPPARVFLGYAILLLMVLAEGMVNAKYFTQGLDTGLIGAFAEAGGLAAINVSIAFLLGKFVVKYCMHFNSFVKVVGIVALAFAGLVMSTIAMGIAHYRDSLISGTVQQFQVDLMGILFPTYQLQSASSWVLFLVSVVFGILALVDGFVSDDLYPGYGAISRRTHEAIDDYEDEVTELQERLEELKHDALLTLDQTIKESQASVAAFESTIDDKRSAGMRLSTALRDADHSLDALLQKFRTENQLHRAGAVRPAYFDERPELRNINTPSFDTTDDDKELSNQFSIVKALLREEQDIRARIQAAFNNQFDRLKPLTSHFPSKGSV